MEQLLIDLVTQYPLLASVVMAIGVFRAIFKPIMGVVDAFVASTETTADDEAVAGFKSGKVYKVLAWIVDYTTSIKLPVKKS